MPVLDMLALNQQELILAHLEYVIEANKTINLTRITSREEAMLLHIEDSLTALSEFDRAPEGLYGDLGSGAGYPGIPLAIATGRQTTLIDFRQKKMITVGRIVKCLGLEDQISTFAGRAELLARKTPNRYAVLTARALAKLPVLMELASPLLKRGGQLFCYKAQLDEAELASAKRAREATGMELVSDRSFKLGDDRARRIVVFEKTSTPTLDLPRQEGAAQKNPLGIK